MVFLITSVITLNNSNVLLCYSVSGGIVSVVTYGVQKAECSDGGIHSTSRPAGSRHLLYAGKIPASCSLLQGGWLTATTERCKWPLYIDWLVPLTGVSLFACFFHWLFACMFLCFFACLSFFSIFIWQQDYWNTCQWISDVQGSFRPQLANLQTVRMNVEPGEPFTVSSGDDFSHWSAKKQWVLCNSRSYGQDCRLSDLVSQRCWTCWI